MFLLYSCNNNPLVQGANQSSFDFSYIPPGEVKIDEVFVGDKSISLNWSVSSSTNNFIVLYRRAGNVTFNQMSVSDSSIDINDLENGSEYEIKVIAKYSSGDLTSDLITVTPDSSISVPALIFDQDINLQLGHSINIIPSLLNEGGLPKSKMQHK